MLTEVRGYNRINGESLRAAGPDVCGGIVVSTVGEKMGDLIMDGKEALNLPR